MGLRTGVVDLDPRRAGRHRCRHVKSKLPLPYQQVRWWCRAARGAAHGNRHRGNLVEELGISEAVGCSGEIEPDLHRGPRIDAVDATVERAVLLEAQEDRRI